jgi:hypothetical protein
MIRMGTAIIVVVTILVVLWFRPGLKAALDTAHGEKTPKAL